MQSATRMARILRHLERVINIPISGPPGYTSLPGFTYADFNRAGKLDFAKIARQLELERMIMIRHPELYNSLTAMDSDNPRIIVLVAQHFTMTETLYERAKICFPMKARVTTADVGKSSTVKKLNVTSDTDQDLITIFRKTVLIDANKRTSVPLPPGELDQRNKMMVKEPLPNFLKGQLKVPDSGTYFRNITVSHEDMDFVFHANAAFYAKALLETAAFAAKDGFLEFARSYGDICFHSLKEVSMLHIGEAFAGDKLTTCIWKDADCETKLLCVVRRCDNGKTIFNGVFSFFEKPIDIV